MKNKILLTGHKGFLGKYVYKELVKNGHEVIGFDLPEHDLTTDDFKCLEGVTDVIHLAALKGIPACDMNPELAVNVNILGSTRLLQACYEKKISKFTYISTWAVNSYNKKMYDITKKTTEEIVIHYIKRKGMDARILRLATFYGGGMASEGCINVFADKAKGGLPAPVIGDGWEIRQFTHVEDITRAVVLTHEKAPCRIEPYVATCKEVININDLAKGICGSIERLPSDDDPENYDVLSSKDIEDLGWKQEISLEEGIRRKIEDD